MASMGALERFLTYVDFEGPAPAHSPDLGPCWLWTGAPNTWGYGQFWVNGRNVAAHAWITRQKIREYDPDTECSQHRCDVRLCVNWERHLFVDLRYQNKVDEVGRGRHARGESHGMTSMTEAVVREIRARSTGARGEQTALAHEYGVTSATIHNILKRKTWTHL